MAKFKDDEVLVATTSFAVDGVVETITRGTELRGNHLAVRKCPQWFVPLGTPKSEWPPEIDHARLLAIAEEQRPETARKYPSIPEDEVVVCIQGFSVFGSAPVAVGARRRRTDPIVKRYPQFFSEQLRPLSDAPR